ncbi:hypothetical protein PPERSA_04729 [Pseudocohnilembus persalinus]|uniref:STOP protein n=1 Tax=Pseudocohnilembus persalinus TaxID=266149 RepID=A0A0V0R4L6_PSEPJ|nr:hypothetical protein PPERSA_04729 [Pseudocohnilembus persalinus]|eukprot:KRX09423.1 hypothetical protein PPERSA_04729 [Pseudocohnilembus persalinus]
MSKVNHPLNCHNKTNHNTGSFKGGKTISDFGLSKQDVSKYDDRKTILSNHYNTLIQKNQHLFDHISGQCICGMCICGRCKCPRQNLEQDYKRGGKSEYQKEFIEKDNNQGRVDDTFYKMQYHNKQPMELSTTNRKDFDPKKIPEYKRVQEERNRDKYLPFAGVSSYGDTYQRFPSNPVAQIKPAAHPTVIKDMPFAGESMYKSYYKGDKVPFDPEVQYMINKNKRGQFKSPLNPDFPFLDETSNKFFYQPFKTRRQPSQLNKNKYDPLPAFDGQFLTTKNQDFQQWQKKKCPARTVLNSMYEADLAKTRSSYGRKSVSKY